MSEREEFYKSGICCDCPQEDALAYYVEAKVREVKREAYKESLRAYRQDKLINWQEYIEKQIIQQNTITNEKE